MGDGSIRTQFDDLLSALKGAGKPVSVQELSSASGLSEKAVLKWLHILEKEGKVHLRNRLSGVFATWLGREPTSPGEEKPLSVSQSFERELSLARENEEQAKGEFSAVPEQPVRSEEQPKGAPQRHKVILESADMQIAEVGEQLAKVDSMIAVLRAQKKLTDSLKQKIAEKKAKEAALAGEKEKEEAKLAEAKAKKEAKIAAKEAALAEAKAKKEAALAEKQARREKRKALKAAALEVAKARKEAKIAAAKARKEAKLAAVKAKEGIKQVELPSPLEEERPMDVPLPPEEETERETQPEPFILESESHGGEKAGPSAYVTIKPLSGAKARKEKIKKPEPLHVAGVSTQFSERLARQVQRIIRQNQEIDKLRAEKEKLLSEHYMPLQRKLESEIETISDRVLRMEKNIIGMQERASNLPGKVSAVEKLQLSSIKAHGQMRRSYDEAAALLEEASRELGEEREKLETLADQSRQEIASHRSKTVELEQALSHIFQLELESNDRVIEARAALAEQAERLASAEGHAQELGALKSEITDGVSSIKRELATTKAILTNIEKQLGQMRQVELYSQSLRNDYEQKMGELGDYIKQGNEDFETLRESVEANFVRRYLKELRELSDSYSFEFGQAKKLEDGIDSRIADEKKKVERAAARDRQCA